MPATQRLDAQLIAGSQLLGNAAGVLTGGSIALSVDRARRIARRARNFTIRARRDRAGLF